jgi:hypothetical protein
LKVKLEIPLDHTTLKGTSPVLPLKTRLSAKQQKFICIYPDISLHLISGYIWLDISRFFIVGLQIVLGKQDLINGDPFIKVNADLFRQLLEPLNYEFY